MFYPAIRGSPNDWRGMPNLTSGKSAFQIPIFYAYRRKIAGVGGRGSEKCNETTSSPFLEKFWKKLPLTILRESRDMSHFINFECNVFSEFLTNRIM